MSMTVIFIHSAGPQGQNQGSSHLIAYLKGKFPSEYHFIYPKMQHPKTPNIASGKNRLMKC